MVNAAQIIPGRIEVIHDFKNAGGSVAAVYPIHYPRSLFRAFDILPVEVWGPPSVDVSQGSAHLQPYVCSIVRNGLSFLQSGGLDVANVLIVPHACDSLQGLGSILLDFISPKQPVLPIYLPRGRRESDLIYFARELRHLFQQLASITGHTPSDSDLLQSIYREEAADDLLGKLHQSRQFLPLSDLDFYRIIRSREYLPAEIFIGLARETLAGAENTTRTGTPLLLSGIVPEPMNVLAVISEMDGMVIADDFACCGRRLYPAGISEDPFRRMAERILYAPPDSTRGNPIQARYEHLLGLMERSGAKGIVFYGIKFCEPELFYLPELRRSLQEAKIPSITIEVDINDSLSYQIRTRLEGFLEMIQ
jgi:benzoyl-CoA reductase/2-hydroxyglutaryl-CoA dehydratase subunit BcrC/BadD/HgdB